MTKPSTAPLRLLKTAALAGLTVLAATGLQSSSPDPGSGVAHVSAADQLDAFPLTIPTYRYGLERERFAEISDTEVERGLTLGELIERYSDNPDVRANLMIRGLEVLDATKLRAGRALTTFTRAGRAYPDYVVYEINDYSQIVFDFVRGDVRIREDQVSTELEVGRSSIQSSLWNAVTDAGYSPQVAVGVTRAIESSISLRSLDKGDAFDMIYERKLVAGEFRGEGRVRMVRLEHRGEIITAIHFARPELGINGWYTLEGESLARGYLLNPVKGARISSGYNLRRFHPVLRYVRPHYGTDYAAPHGAPIMSVADGTVVEVGRTGGNGNYVKVKHDDTHATQYLHMSRHARGLRRGQRVTQGQTIGYVGSTGLATGPHVCFRFWKHGKQVNHLRIELPRAKPLPAELLGEFAAERDALLIQMDGGGAVSSGGLQAGAGVGA